MKETDPVKTGKGEENDDDVDEFVEFYQQNILILNCSKLWTVQCV